MNLSCGNCKAIRSFSGQPPTCDECRWVYAAGAMRKAAKRTNEADTVIRAAGAGVGAALFVGLCVAFLFYAYEDYSENRTATVQEVHDGAGGTFKLYMNDGTVWLAPRGFSVIAGDRIRYKNGGDISKAGSDTSNFCYLTNVTRGSEIAAERIEGPTKGTSCPAN
jgi:hypothetical protein